MSDESILVDANVLVYAFHQESEHHSASRGILNQAQGGKVLLCVTPQVLAEFYAVVTDHRRVAAPRHPEEALQAIGLILAMPGMTLLPTPDGLVDRWVVLARQHPVTGGAVFDLQLVATMLGNGVSKIYTFDRSHFERFNEIEVLRP